MPDPDGANHCLARYQLWEAAVPPEGRDQEFYFQAEDELRVAQDDYCARAVEGSP